MLKGSIFAIVMLGMAISAQAEDKKEHKSIPECESIVKACDAGGFKPGMHKENGKGTWVDCVGKIAKGETVQGVTGVSKEDATKCLEARKSKRDEHMAKKKEAANTEKK